MPKLLSPPRPTQRTVDYSVSSARYQQLEIYSYILEGRKPTLAELCREIPEVIPQKSARKRRRFIADRDKLGLPSVRKYPKDWAEISRQAKETQNYRCQVCGCQGLRPEDDKSNLTLSEIGKRTLNTHHVDGNGLNNDPDNLFVVCTTHHLEIHRNKKTPHLGQLTLSFQ